MVVVIKFKVDRASAGAQSILPPFGYGGNINTAMAFTETLLDKIINCLGRLVCNWMSLLNLELSKGAIMNSPTLYTPKQVADYLHVSRGTIYSMISRHEIQSVKVGRNRRFTNEHIQDFIRTRQTVVVSDI